MARLKRMPKRTSKKLDSVQNARRVVLESVGQYEEVTITTGLLSQVMSAMGRKGGKTGGKRRMELLSPEQRSQMGKLAAEKRWGKKKSAK